MSQPSRDTRLPTRRQCDLALIVRCSECSRRVPVCTYSYVCARYGVSVCWLDGLGWLGWPASPHPPHTHKSIKPRPADRGDLGQILPARYRRCICPLSKPAMTPVGAPGFLELHWLVSCRRLTTPHHTIMPHPIRLGTKRQALPLGPTMPILPSCSSSFPDLPFTSSHPDHRVFPPFFPSRPRCLSQP